MLNQEIKTPKRIIRDVANKNKASITFSFQYYTVDVTDGRFHYVTA